MPTSWLPKLILVEDYDNDWAEHDRIVYNTFLSDLINYNPNFQLKRFSLNKKEKTDGRENIFWHCITEGPVEADRTVDPRRCERIGWIRPLVEEYPKTRMFAWATGRHHRKGGGGEKRILISPTDFSYLPTAWINRINRQFFSFQK